MFCMRLSSFFVKGKISSLVLMAADKDKLRIDRTNRRPLLQRISSLDVAT